LQINNAAVGDHTTPNTLGTFNIYSPRYFLVNYHMQNYSHAMLPIEKMAPSREIKSSPKNPPREPSN